MDDLAQLSFGLILFAAIAASGASASLQGQIDLANASPVYVLPATYRENIVVSRPLEVIGIDGPSVVSDNLAVSTFRITSHGVTITGLNITGAKNASGIDVSSSDVRMVYDNIYGSGTGLRSTSSKEVDARHCYWGFSGQGIHRGEPGAGSNNDVLGKVMYSPWLTAMVRNGLVEQDNPLHSLDNLRAGINLEIIGGLNNGMEMGSAAYLSAPYSSAAVPGVAVRYVDAFVDGNSGGTARVTVSYSDFELSDVVESSLNLYIWNKSSWSLASDVSRDLTSNKVAGSFPVSLLNGSPVALAGLDYSVAILPVQSPNQPISSVPVFSTFRIESYYPIRSIYYRVDNASSWKLVQSNVNAKSWNWPGWAMGESDWSELGEGSHTMYFKFDRSGKGNTVGAKGEIAWKFSKSTKVGKLELLQPNGGETLNRQPYIIRWSLPYPDGVSDVALYYSTNGGATYPYLIEKLQGGAIGYSWRSPNIKTNLGRVKVVVRYANGKVYSDQSDYNFWIEKGFSLQARRPSFGFTSFEALPKPPFSFHLG
jgi:hypothetical protein